MTHYLQYSTVYDLVLYCDDDDGDDDVCVCVCVRVYYVRTRADHLIPGLIFFLS